MFDLPPPRHISTLRIFPVAAGSDEGPFGEPTAVARRLQRDRRLHPSSRLGVRAAEFRDAGGDTEGGCYADGGGGEATLDAVVAKPGQGRSRSTFVLGVLARLFVLVLVAMLSAWRYKLTTRLPGASEARPKFARMRCGSRNSPRANSIGSSRTVARSSPRSPIFRRRVIATGSTVRIMSHRCKEAFRNMPRSARSTCSDVPSVQASPFRRVRPPPTGSSFKRPGTPASSSSAST